MISIESMVAIWVAMVGISEVIWVVSIAIVAIGSIGSRLGISGPLAIVMSIMVGIRVSIVSMVGISKMMSISIMTIMDTSSGISFRFSVSRPLAIVVSIVVGIWVSIVSMVGIAKMMAISIVTIVKTSISRCISLASSSGEHAQGNNSNGFHHFECLRARGFS